MKRIFISFFALILSSYIAYQNAGYCGELLTIDDALKAVLSANPGIEAAEFEYEAAKSRPAQAATLPDPEFMVDFMSVPTNTADVSRGTVQYMVEQKIPFPSKLALSYKAEKKQALAIKSGAAAASQEIIRQTKYAYIDVWRLGEEERINRETLSMYSIGKGSAEAAYAEAKGNMADPVLASVELGDIEGQLAIAHQDRLVAIATLSRFMAIDIESSIVTESPHLPNSVVELKTLIEKSKETRPEIAATSNLVEAQRAKRSLAKAAFIPDFSFRFGFMDNPSGQPNAWYGRAGISVPLWSFSKQRLGVKEADAMYKRAQSMKQDEVLATQSDIKSAYARFQGAKKIIDIYASKVIPRARLLVSSSRQAYSSEKAGFFGVVDGIRSLNNAKIILARAKADAAKAYADLERAVGAEIQ